MFRQSFNTGVDKEMPLAGRHSLKLSKYVIQDLILMEKTFQLNILMFNRKQRSQTQAPTEQWKIPKIRELHSLKHGEVVICSF